MAAVIHEVTVASWNIREALPVGSTSPSARNEARREIERTAEQRRIDVLAMQEVDFDEDSTSETLEHLRENTGLQYFVVHSLSPSSYFPGQRAGVAIASRTPIENPRAGLFPNPNLVSVRDGQEYRSHDKGFVSGVVHDDDGLELTVASVHALPFYLFERSPDDPHFEELWLTMSTTLGKLTRDNLVICGDFNSPDRGPLLGSGALDVVPTNDTDTYRSMSADDVLVSRRVNPVKNEVLENFSDHAAVIGKFVIS